MTETSHWPDWPVIVRSMLDRHQLRCHRPIGDIAAAPAQPPPQAISSEALDVEVAAQYRLFASLLESKSIEDRFPSLRGSRRWRYILENYRVADQVTLQYFKDEAGTQKALCRHILNSRRHNSVVKTYCQQILAKGVINEARGQVIAANIGR